MRSSRRGSRGSRSRSPSRSSRRSPVRSNSPSRSSVGSRTRSRSPIRSSRRSPVRSRSPRRSPRLGIHLHSRPFQRLWRPFRVYRNVWVYSNYGTTLRIPPQNNVSGAVNTWNGFSTTIGSLSSVLEGFGPLRSLYMDRKYFVAVYEQSSHAVAARGFVASGGISGFEVFNPSPDYNLETEYTPMTTEELRNEFSLYGSIANVRRNTKTASVTFSTSDAALLAAEELSLKRKGSTVYVDL